MDVSKLIPISKKSGVDLEYPIGFHLMTLSWTLACEDGGLLSVGMKARIPLFGRVNDKTLNPKPLRRFI